MHGTPFKKLPTPKSLQRNDLMLPKEMFIRPRVDYSTFSIKNRALKFNLVVDILVLWIKAIYFDLLVTQKGKMP